MSATWLTIADLHNPKGWTAIMLHKGDYIEADSEDQGWQEYPGSMELWQKMEHGPLLRVRRWLKKSILAYYRP